VAAPCFEDLAVDFPTVRRSKRVTSILARGAIQHTGQKHPCTKMTFLCLGKTISGFPGRLGTWSRNLYPQDRAIFLTKSSGFVFLP